MKSIEKNEWNNLKLGNVAEIATEFSKSAGSGLHLQLPLCFILSHYNLQLSSTFLEPK